MEARHTLAMGARRGTERGAVMATSKRIDPFFTSLIKSSKPTMEAPASFASSAYFPSANTAILGTFPVPWGS